VAVYQGNGRQNHFDVQVSSDNMTWTNALTGASTSLGLTEQTFDFPVRAARWVRYFGHGNTVNLWNSLTEINVYEPAGSNTPTPAPVEVTLPASAATASTNDGNVPANALDGSLDTRWSALGDGQWLQLDLGATRTITHVRIATFNGNQRQSRFDLQISSDGLAWSNVLTGALTSGTTLAEETFELDDVPARFVRYLGHGNTASAWNSVTEVSVFAVP
jgi:hypothetical protein